MFVPEKVVVKASQINLRSSPQLSSSTIIGQLPSGTILDVLELPNKGALVELNGRWSPWYKLRTEDGRVGYALGDFLSPALTIQFEEALLDGNLPPLNWYGIYQKGKSSDEIRRIQVRKEPVYSEAMDETMYVLRTNQPDTAKYIIGTIETMQEGYAGPLGVMEAAGWNSTAEMSPGVQVPLETGREPALGSAPVSYILAATGCADWEENAMTIRNYRLRLVEVHAEDQRVQDLSPWFECEHGHPPTIQLLWYGDLDCDQIPDLLIHDCPFEIGCRTSLFLSSRARQNELVRKVGEFFWQGN
jgi:hypothetical protein